MKRREVVAAFLSACSAPYWASAQEPTVKKIGFLDSGEPTAFRGRLIAFKGGLRELGFDEGRNLVVHYRWAAGRYEQLDALATELVNSKVQVLVATGSPNSAQAATRS